MQELFFVCTCFCLIFISFLNNLVTAFDRTSPVSVFMRLNIFGDLDVFDVVNVIAVLRVCPIVFGLNDCKL